MKNPIQSIKDNRLINLTGNRINGFTETFQQERLSPQEGAKFNSFWSAFNNAPDKSSKIKAAIMINQLLDEYEQNFAKKDSTQVRL